MWCVCVRVCGVCVCAGVHTAPTVVGQHELCGTQSVFVWELVFAFAISLNEILCAKHKYGKFIM